MLISPGDSKADFELGVQEGTYYMTFSADCFDYGYYAGTSELKEYKDRLVFEVTSSMEDIYVLPVVSTDSGEVVGETYNISADFGVASEEREYLVILADSAAENRDVYDYNYVNVEAGWKTLNTRFNVYSAPEQLYMSIKEVTGATDAYVSEPDGTELFYSEEYGFTSNPDYASDISGVYDISASYKNTVTISGNIEYSGSSPAEYQYIYVGAEFENELYVDRARISNGTYSIVVPEYLSGGSFKLFTTNDHYGRLNQEDKLYNEREYVLDGNISINANAGKYAIVCGTISLPYGAPKDGINVELSGRGNRYVECGTYVINPGETNIGYTEVFSENFFENGNMSAVDLTLDIIRMCLKLFPPKTES